MTIVSVWTDYVGKCQKAKRIKVEGHTEYADNGYDIVCSSISTAMIITANLIEKITTECKINYDSKNVMIDIQLLNPDDITYTIMDNLLHTLTDLNKQYPKYVKIETFKG